VLPYSRRIMFPDPRVICVETPISPDDLTQPGYTFARIYRLLVALRWKRVDGILQRTVGLSLELVVGHDWDPNVSTGVAEKWSTYEG